MDIIPDHLALALHFFYELLYKSGPIFLFLALVLGIVGLPAPDELLLIASGYLVAHNKLSLTPTLLAAVLGSMCGITVSYLLGRLIGYLTIEKYGKKLNITEDKVNMAKGWFTTIGKWILFFGYYIPLFRHIIGFVAGLIKLDYKSFALFAYAGAAVWSLTFFSIGYFFFDRFTGLFSK